MNVSGIYHNIFSVSHVFLKLFEFLGSKFQSVAVLQILIQNASIVQSATEKLLS